MPTVAMHAWKPCIITEEAFGPSFFGMLMTCFHSFSCNELLQDEATLLKQAAFSYCYCFPQPDEAIAISDLPKFSLAGNDQLQTYLPDSWPLCTIKIAPHQIGCCPPRR